MFFFSVLEFSFFFVGLHWLAPTLLGKTSVNLEAIQKESALACPNLFNLNCKMLQFRKSMKLVFHYPDLSVQMLDHFFPLLFPKDSDL